MSHSNSPITSSKACARRAAPLPNAYEQDGCKSPTTKSPISRSPKKSIPSADYYDALDLPKVSGILYKWVNIGKGWKARWFCLEDGVLSYYKIRGPDRISISSEKLKNLRIIGEEAQRLLRKQKNTTSVYEKRPKRVLGELHLKVSSFRESKSDDRKFYVYTGTKTLYLRAECKEDRASWLEAFQWAKELFPRSYSSTDIVVPSEVPIMPTGRLCQKLQELGVSSDGIKECEDIVLSEFQKLQQKLQDMRHKQLCLIEKLRYLEVEKFDLETTVVDEMQSQVPGGSAVGSLKDHVLNLLGASETDSDDESVQPYTGADSEDEDNTFFDTQEVFVDSNHSPSFPDDTLATELALSVGFGYPVIERRKKLPDPKEQEKAVSLWSMIRDNIGKDLSKVCLPVYFNEPLSTLQKCFEDLEYSQLLDQAQEWGKKGDGLMRMLHVAAFAVSSYSSTEGRLRKPFNPLLGETYEADCPDKGLRFVSEKVSHHPMVIACHCEGRGWKFWGDSMLKSKFWGRSIELNPVGILTLEFDDGEVFQWSKVTSSINNLILGKLYVDHYGTMKIQGNRQFSCKMKFKEQSLLEKNPHQVQGYVQRADGENVATLIGKWDESICYVLGDPSTKPNKNEARLLWKKNKPPTFPTRYNLTSFAITLNEITPGLKEKLPRTDSRLRPDQRHLENGEYEQANVEKQRLEHKQRQARKIQETGWVPKWFSLDKGTFCYKGGYWEAREFGQWQNCPDIFGPDPIDEGLYKD